MTTPQSRQRKALGRAIRPVSLPPRRSSPGRVGMGRPETSSDQNTGLRLLRKPPSISFFFYGHSITGTPFRRPDGLRGRIILRAPAGQNKTRPCLCKETKAQTSAVPLFLPGDNAPGHSRLPGNGGFRRGLLLASALRSKGMPPVSSRPPCTKRRLSARIGGGDLSFSTRFHTMCSISYPVLARMSRGRAGICVSPPPRGAGTPRKILNRGIENKIRNFPKSMVYWGKKTAGSPRRTR